MFTRPSIVLTTLFILIFPIDVLVRTTSAVELSRQSIDEQWSHWKRVHNKRYKSGEEHDRRRANWVRNLVTVMQHNVNHDLGLVSYSMELNGFTDLSWTEFRDRYARGYRSDLLKVRGSRLSDLSTPFNASEIGGVPDRVDWRDQGLVREVKNQVNEIVLS